MYVHANFQDATIHNKKVTREEVELFDQPSYFNYSMLLPLKLLDIICSFQNFTQEVYACVEVQNTENFKHLDFHSFWCSWILIKFIFVKFLEVSLFHLNQGRWKFSPSLFKLITSSRLCHTQSIWMHSSCWYISNTCHTFYILFCGY